MERGLEPHDVRIDFTLTKLKSLNAGWVMNYHKKMHWSASVVKNGFQKVKTLEAFKEADTFINLAENSFVEIIIEQ